MKWVLIIGALLVVTALTPVFIGAFAPKASGKHLLKKTLKEMGADSRFLQDGFINESIADCYKVAKFWAQYGENKKFTTEFVDGIKGYAYNILKYREDFMIGRLAYEKDSYIGDIIDRMKRYNII